jgi:hypothetical protein
VGPQSNAIETWAGWSVMMQTYRKVMNASADPKLVIFHHNSTTGTDYQSIRYGLGSNRYDEFDAALGYPTLSGNQDPTVNNGQTVTSVTLQDRDAVILIRQ